MSWIFRVFCPVHIRGVRMNQQKGNAELPVVVECQKGLFSKDVLEDWEMEKKLVGGN